MSFAHNMFTRCGSLSNVLMFLVVLYMSYLKVSWIQCPFCKSFERSIGIIVGHFKKFGIKVVMVEVEIVSMGEGSIGYISLDHVLFLLRSLFFEVGGAICICIFCFGNSLLT